MGLFMSSHLFATQSFCILLSRLDSLLLEMATQHGSDFPMSLSPDAWVVVPIWRTENKRAFNLPPTPPPTASKGMRCCFLPSTISGNTEITCRLKLCLYRKDHNLEYLLACQVPKGGLSLPSNRKDCPLCLRERTNPAMAAASGFVFCYPCIFTYIQKVGGYGRGVDV